MSVDKLVDSAQLDSDLTSVANAIRTKGGTSASLAFPAGFVSAINAIPTGSGIDVEPLSVTQNGTYSAPTGKAYSPVTVNVSGGGGGAYPWFSPSAELVQRLYTGTFNLSADTDFDSWTPSTTASVILPESAVDDFTYTTSLTDYDIAFVFNTMVDVKYLPGATMTAAVIKFGASLRYLVFGNLATTDLTAGVPSSYTTYSLGDLKGTSYYNGSGALVGRMSLQYGAAYFTSNRAPTNSFSSGLYTATWKRPSFSARCSSSYFSTARKAEVDSANSSIVMTVDLVRSPRGDSPWSRVQNDFRAMFFSP